MTPSDRSLEREITPRQVYLDRRAWMRGGVAAASVAASAWLYRRLNGVDQVTTARPAIEHLVKAAPAPERGFWVDEPMTPRASVLNYNNFYEFSTDKDGVAKAAAGFSTAGWKVTVDGLVHEPRVFDLADLRAVSPPEERVYRMRCVEAWSMVIPWAGLPLGKLLAVARPMSSARYVAFQTLHDPDRMPNQKTGVLEWPYVEGLRIDEAMHPLALLATGLYGEELPPQDGAPVRLVTPWKYGFKGIKSIVKITLTDKEPPSTWNRYAPKEYGFYANVNPNHDHPRWSQATEQRIGETGRRKTLMFNGYADQVASLYAGMDLDVHY
ncbi:MAG TPA: protein-methionine-sulfoxide reductase catalytic subunit MsrP [Kofleriaceae bacterium]|nr:protein-methionine-sulfoxide reductase catalytic subunit MsrP [Kofleriaceae bacterium]